MAQKCLDVYTGAVRWFPENGNVLAQTDWLLECLYAAWKTWFINAHKPTHSISITPDDRLFMEWLLPPDYQPPSGYDKNAAQELKAKLG